jgi:hypothetical protein
MSRMNKKATLPKISIEKYCDLIEVVITRSGVHDIKGRELPIGAIIEVSSKQFKSLIHKCELADSDVVTVEPNDPVAPPLTDKDRERALALSESESEEDTEE